MVGGEPPVTLRVEWASMKFPQMFYSWTQLKKKEKRKKETTQVHELSRENGSEMKGEEALFWLDAKFMFKGV